MMKKIFFFVSLLALSFQQALAIQCILPDAAGQPSNGKLVEVLISDDDHTNFSQASRKCSNYFQYYIEGFKSIGAHVPTQAECLADPSIINLSQGFAPFGAFFRSKVLSSGTDTVIKSSNIKDYKWEIYGPFENGNPLIASYDSFNAAYIFEVPGTYTAKLTVTFNDNSTSTDEKVVTVWPRNGNTFYVDAILGDDRNDGLSQTPDASCDRSANPVGTCIGPWKTATRGFDVLIQHNWDNKSSKFSSFDACSTTSIREAKKISGDFYSLYAGESVTGDATNIQVCDTQSQGPKIAKPGDQVLFKRGQRFELNEGIVSLYKYSSGGLKYERLFLDTIFNLSLTSSGSGILFSSYGSSGKKPLITRNGPIGNNVFNIGSLNLHISFQDLDFDLENPSALKHPFATDTASNKRGNFLVASPINLVLNRTSVKRMNNGITSDSHGLFIKDSSFYNSYVVQMFSSSATDVALINNKFDYSYNHLLYTDFRNSLIIGNTFSRPSGGRTALRIAGSDPTHHRTHSNWISNNIFEGWIDPRKCSPTGNCLSFGDTRRYTYSLVEFHTNTNAITFDDRLVFKRNILKNAETLLLIGDNAHTLIEGNIFDSKESYAYFAPRIKLHSSASNRPLNDVIVRNNLFVERNAQLNPKMVINNLADYTGSAIGTVCDDLISHKDISIENNQYLSVSPMCAIGKSTVTGTGVACVVDTSQNANETLTTATGLTATTNQVVTGVTQTSINQAVANKITEISTGIPAPAIQPVIPKPVESKTSVIKNLKKKK